MDNRYKPLTDYVKHRFIEHLGTRLQSIFIKGSVARGDALWGVSDIDLVLAFESPTPSDTAVKREVEIAAKILPAGDSLVIQRIGVDRLIQMSEGTRAYTLFSARHDVEVLFGKSPAEFLPDPPRGKELTKLIAPIIRKDGERKISNTSLERNETRLIAKRILQGLALPAIAEGEIEYITPLQVPTFEYPLKIQKYFPYILSMYSEAPQLSDTRSIINAWRDVWDFIESKEIAEF